MNEFALAPEASPVAAQKTRAQKLLEPFRGDIEHCVRCGLCQSVCPLYKETGLEGSVARGKMSLLLGLLDGQISASANFQEKLDFCLICKACTAICPAGVKVDELVVLGRQVAQAERGLPRLKRVALALLTGRGFWRQFLLALGRFWERLWLRPVPGQRGGWPRFSLPGLPDRLYPWIGGRASFQRGRPADKRVIGREGSFRDKGEARRGENRGTSPRRVIFFPGCAVESFYPEIGRAVEKVFERRGFTVIVPPGLVCCGAPAYFAGDRSRAEALARRNLAILNRALAETGAEAVLTACASGGLMLKKEYADLLGPEDATAVRFLSQKVFDVSEFLVDRGLLKAGDAILGSSSPSTLTMRPAPSDPSLKVTYHDPCHLNRGQGISRQPRQIIEALNGVELVEAKEAARCCGGAGTFAFFHQPIAEAVLKRKVDDILATGAGVVATGCPSCLMQLESGLARAQTRVHALHTVELLNLVEEGTGWQLPRE